MKFWCLLLLCCSLVALGSEHRSSMRSDHSWFYLFGGLGEAYGPSDLRLGLGPVELGLIQGRLLGVVSPVDLNSSYYLVWGAGQYLPANEWKNFSLYAGLGKDFWRWWWINFRWELGMYTNLSNYTGGRLTVGLNLGW